MDGQDKVDDMDAEVQIARCQSVPDSPVTHFYITLH